VGVRACADRSWSARRSSLPTVAAPCFPDQPPYDDDYLREGHPEIDHPPHPLRAPYKLLVGVVPRTRPLHHRLLAQNGAGLPLFEISPSSPRSLRRSRVAFESYARSRWTFVPSGNPPRVWATVWRVSGSSGESSWRLAGAVRVLKGMPFASTAVERLMPCFPLSTGFVPAFSPPPSMPW